jgi:hypothetical protein
MEMYHSDSNHPLSKGKFLDIALCGIHLKVIYDTPQLSFFRRDLEVPGTLPSFLPYAVAW